MNTNALPAPPTVDTPPSGGVIATFLGISVVFYVVLAVGCAGYLLWKAYAPTATEPLSNFDKLAIAALIAVVGTGLTALGTVYSATRQSATAYQVGQLASQTSVALAHYKNTSDKSLADIRANVDASLAQLTAASDEALARLKVGLDAGHVAYRELFGTATVYFHALRSITHGSWDEASLRKVETAMIGATRQIIHVAENKDMRNQWFDFWQCAQDIRWKAHREADPDKRPKLVADLMVEKRTYAWGCLDLRELHSKLEETAQNAIKNAVTGLPAI